MLKFRKISGSAIMMVFSYLRPLVENDDETFLSAINKTPLSTYNSNMPWIDDENVASAETWNCLNMNHALISVYLLASLLAIVGSAVWLWKLCRTKQKKKTIIYFICYATTCLIVSINHAYQMIRTRFYDPNHSELTPIQCLISTIYPLVYSITDIAATQLILFMATDFLFVILNVQWCQKRNDFCHVCMPFSVYLFTATFDLLFCIASALTKKAQSVPAACVYGDITSKKYLIVHSFMCSLASVLAIVALAWSVVVIRRKKSHSSTVQQIQLKRQTIVVPKLITIVIATLIIHSIPSVVILCLVIHTKKSAAVHWLWCFQLIGISLHTIYRIFEERRLNNLRAVQKFMNSGFYKHTMFNLQKLKSKQVTILRTTDTKH